MNNYLGIDTSNYTTSVAIANDNGVIQNKKLLPVKEGTLGLRQSDAVFHHVQQLPQILDKLLPTDNIKAVGVSFAPRRVEGSYMPCFTVGMCNANAISMALDVPLYEFSHQEGHIAAALYSSHNLNLIGEKFLAFHVSGGTTEALLVSPSNDTPLSCTLIAKTLDLSAGQAIDRVGVMLGLKFPCGPELEKLALQFDGKLKVKPTLKEENLCLSGVENLCKKMFSDGEPKEKIAYFCIEYILSSLDECTEKLCRKYPNLPIIYSGGVMSNTIIKERLSKKYGGFFATPEFSADNAAGTAILTKWKNQIKI